ncbi:hypothetical protein ACJJTC_001902 [Scirpophaga incertulas]
MDDFNGNEGSVVSEHYNIDSEQNSESTYRNCFEILESESSLDEYEADRNLMIRRKIKKWAIDKNIPQSALNDLIEIINDRFTNLLPQDARTILHTTTKVNIKSIDNDSDYWHNGFHYQLNLLFDNMVDVPDFVSFIINFDGLPIFKSSKKEFWPILCAIHEYPDLHPFVIGIYYGNGKPKNLDIYLEDFVKEMRRLLEDGIYHKQNNKKNCNQKTSESDVK